MHFTIFTKGGCGKALTNVSISLASGLSINGHKVDLVVTNESINKLTKHYSNIHGFSNVKIFNLGISNTSFSIPFLALYLRKNKPDYLFSQLSICNIAAIAAKYLANVHCKNIFLEGTIVSKIAPIDSKENFKLKFLPPLIRKIYPLADAIICKSPDVQNDLSTFLAKSTQQTKLTFLPNPYPLERFLKLAKREVTFPWGDTNDLPLIISVGRLSKAKAFDILIHAFHSVRQSHKCRLLILGEGPLRKDLEVLIKQLALSKDIFMPGSVTNPWKYMAKAQIFALASRFEGWPSALTEAMSLGIPSITTNCAGGGRIMIKNGTTGFVVPVDNPKEFADKLLLLVKDKSLCHKLGRAAQQKSANYDYQKIAADYATFAQTLE